MGYLLSIIYPHAMLPFLDEHCFTLLAILYVGIVPFGACYNEFVSVLISYKRTKRRNLIYYVNSPIPGTDSKTTGTPHTLKFLMLMLMHMAQKSLSQLPQEKYKQTTQQNYDTS